MKGVILILGMFLATAAIMFMVAKACEDEDNNQ